MAGPARSNDNPEPITDTASLTALCERLSATPYITIDTEFMRERTYWPVLCLVQLAGPDEAAIVDPMAPGIDLAPLYALLSNPAVLKVFHAARQDVETFLHLTGEVPHPLFDTQVAAMVCGFGDSVSYETLAAQLARARIDKSLRFTDWAARPLSPRQLDYALADVTHLRQVYEALSRRLAKEGRAHWLDDEMAQLHDPATYIVAPEDAWKRLKPRSANPRLLAILQELAAWRERAARERDVPRQRLLRDETLLEIAAQGPTTIEALARTRGLSQGFAEGRQGAAILETVARAVAIPREEMPEPVDRPALPRRLGPTVELLKLLLKLDCDRHEVAQKLVASSADIEAIAGDDEAAVPALAGWRREVFGEDALRLKSGKLGLALGKDGIRLIAIEPEG